MARRNPPGCWLVEPCLLESIMNFDPYLNVDPGTAFPLQRGDVFMSDNGPAPGRS